MCDPNRDHENCVDNEQDNARHASEKAIAQDDALDRDVVAARQEGAANSDVAANVQMQVPGASNSDADSNNAEQQKSVYERQRIFPGQERKYLLTHRIRYAREKTECRSLPNQIRQASAQIIPQMKSYLREM